MFVRAYLRASTKEQDATRAREQLEAFAAQRGLEIASWYIENESGASLKRPELQRLLKDCRRGDVLLVEQVDRLTRLAPEQWEELFAEIKAKGLRVVALDLPLSHKIADEAGDDFTRRMLEAVGEMMLHVLAAIARKDYEDRQRRQAQGIKKAKAEGRYKGRPANDERNEAIKAMIRSGQTFGTIIKATGVSRQHVANLKKTVEAEKLLAGGRVAAAR
ncbi:MAG: recombinase family protein [Rhizobiaceae bacterium]